MHENLTDLLQARISTLQDSTAAARQLNETLQFEGCERQTQDGIGPEQHPYTANITLANGSRNLSVGNVQDDIDNGLFSDQNEAITPEVRDDNHIGPTRNSTTCGEGGFPIRNDSLAGLIYEEMHNTAQVGKQGNHGESRASDDCAHQGDATRSQDEIGLQQEYYDRHSILSPAPQVDSRQLLEDLSGFYQAQQVNSDEILIDINTYSAPQVDSRQLLDDLSGFYQAQQVNSDEILIDINTYSAPQVDSRELLNDLGTSNLYQVQQVNSDELLDEMRRSSATDIDDLLREADNFTRSCEKRSHQFIMTATPVS
ncbi:Hypothetical protein PENO1_110810 [Penicillium occitanis (nom. inval.)]|nr:Hypothetical protein PENO1_110810 [Penicillium occitanis (nom. inval.)]PCG88425.1 hypothetical protein PENOC_111080 [Penicillium occitanis (nom. inval.)]